MFTVLTLDEGVGVALGEVVEQAVVAAGLALGAPLLLMHRLVAGAHVALLRRQVHLLARLQVRLERLHQLIHRLLHQVALSVTVRGVCHTLNS